MSSVPPLILSSDSHVFEPPDLWTTRIDKAFRHRAPRMVRIDGADQLVVEEHDILSGPGELGAILPRGGNEEKRGAAVGPGRRSHDQCEGPGAEKESASLAIVGSVPDRTGRKRKSQAITAKPRNQLLRR